MKKHVLPCLEQAFVPRMCSQGSGGRRRGLLRRLESSGVDSWRTPTKTCRASETRRCQLGDQSHPTVLSLGTARCQRHTGGVPDDGEAASIEHQFGWISGLGSGGISGRCALLTSDKPTITAIEP